MGWLSDAWDSVKDFGKSLVKGIVNIGKSIFNFVGDVFSFVLNPFGALTDVPDPNIGVNAGEQAKGITVTKNGTNTPIPVVYGYRRLGGSVVFAETNGTDNKYLYVCYTLCQGEIKGVRRLFVQDVELPTSMFTATDNTLPAGQIVKPATGRYKNLLQVQAFYGADGDAQSTLLNGSSSWGKKTRTIPGVAYLAFRFEFPEVKTQEDQDANPWTGGIPTIQAEVYGKKVFDVSQFTGDSAGVDLTGSYSTLTKDYSINPVNHLLDYMLDPNWGVGLDLDEIDADSFARGANKCLQYVTYFSNERGRALTGNSVLDSSSKLLDNVKILLQGSRGILPYVQGKYQLTIEDGGNPTDITSSVATVTYQVDDTDIIDAIEMRGEAKNSKFNQVVVNYIEPQTDFQNQSVTYPKEGTFEYSNALSEDDFQELKGEFNFPTITNAYLAEDFAKMIFQKSRGQRQISFKAQPDLMTVTPGDIIEVTNSRLDLSGQAFRVVGMNIATDSTVSIEAVEHDPTIYPFIFTDEKDVYEQPKISDPFYDKPIAPITPDKPHRPVIDPDPNPPDDKLKPDDGDPPTDSEGKPETPIQIGPVPNPAPDETQIPDPSDIQVKSFTSVVAPSFGRISPGLGFNNTPSARAGSSQEHLIDDVFRLAYNDSERIHSTVSDGNVTATPNINAFDVLNLAYYPVLKDNFNKDTALNTIAYYRNYAVTNFSTQQPWSNFQPIVDTVGTYNPYALTPLFDTSVSVPDTGYQTPTMTTIDDQLYDYLDTAGVIIFQTFNFDYEDSANQSVGGMRITFSAAHGLTDGVRIRFVPSGGTADEQRAFNFIDNYLAYVKVIDSTTVELYNRFNQGVLPYQAPQFSRPFGGFFYSSTGNKWVNFTSVTGSHKLEVVNNRGSTAGYAYTAVNVFEKLKRFPGCSIYNPYEAWTRGQNLTTPTNSTSLGVTPTVEFEKPTDTEIQKRGPKGLYPKIFVNPPSDYKGIVIYKGTVAGGMIKNGGYYFNMADAKWEDEFGFFTWPWCGGNEQGFNPALLVQSNKDFFKIRFTDTGRRDVANILLRDGSQPTSNAEWYDDVKHDPAMVYDLPGWTYRTDTGAFVTGYGIEAYLNYSIQQLTTADFEANTTLTTNHALGG